MLYAQTNRTKKYKITSLGPSKFQDTPGFK